MHANKTHKVIFSLKCYNIFNNHLIINYVIFKKESIIIHAHKIKGFNS